MENLQSDLDALSSKIDQELEDTRVKGKYLLRDLMDCDSIAPSLQN